MSNMFSITNIKNRLISVIAPDIPPLPSVPSHQLNRGGIISAASNYQMRMAHQQNKRDKFAYARPPFLQLLTIDELRASADHNVRPIIVPRDIYLLPWGTGYAECVNSGKSEWNEDQAAFCRRVLSDPTHSHPGLPYTYYGIFDGHAGYGAALAASHQFHHILHEKLVDCLELLLRPDEESINANPNSGFLHPSQLHRRVSKDDLIIGALESAFFSMDALIAQDRNRYRDAGGCTACVALFINGKLFVANAGDSRAVLCQRRSGTTHDEKHKSATSTTSVISAERNTDAQEVFAVPFSFDHTPETERQRLLTVALLVPHLIGEQYTAMEYSKRPNAKDLGQRILCRQGTMKGWTYKTLTGEDLRMPVVTGEGKRSRLLGTLGVTRGFGDHDLLAISTGTKIKPFLTPHPEVVVRDLSKIVSIPGENNEDGDYGILVMATDGLWDVSENEAVARTVFQTLTKYPTEEHRYTMVAQELVARARGKINDSGHWRLADSKAAATVDDISVIVIPVYQYYKEAAEWEKKCVQLLKELKERRAKMTQSATEACEDETLVNGVTKAQVEIGHDEEEEEEVVVEVNRQQAQATVEIEEDVHKKPENGEQAQLANSEASKVGLTMTANDMNELIENELTAAISTLDAIEQAEDDVKKEETGTFATIQEKTNQEEKSKQHQQHQQHRNRNRKDKR
ncbi:protein phosphatase 1H isoform X1 [Anastrepha ludens]|uniref:protein phosphatase 1H isoform X1 n=1 Tax=Anastrepha ludens TaxID=28586 RepID=UPI0023B1E571|nr:protein phosphatase 1H isoform X1 [Anastrepha ludens]XP_053948437.1 protein phosphatase 1H isoform X1 [Anastrepha ludens]